MLYSAIVYPHVVNSEKRSAATEQMPDPYSDLVENGFLYVLPAEDPEFSPNTCSEKLLGGGWQAI